MGNISKVKNRLYTLDGDVVAVPFIYDNEMNGYFGNYPDFKEMPRLTPEGRQWVNVTMEGCPYADTDYGDCGSCQFFRCEHPGDLIGICDNEKLRVIKTQTVTPELTRKENVI